jgi:hypothetical protein
MPFCTNKANDYEWLSESEIHRGMAPGRTCAEGQSRAGSVGPDGRCRVQDQAVRSYLDLNVLVQTCAAGKAMTDSRLGVQAVWCPHC